MMRLLSPIRRILLASYPGLWLYSGGLFLFGLLGAYKAGFSLLPAALWYGLWFIGPANIFGMLLNDYFDRTLDEFNPRKRAPKVSGRACMTGIGLALGSFLILYALYPSIPVLFCVLVAIAGNVAYSVPPLRFKERPPLDVLIGAFSYLPIAVAGYVLMAGTLPGAPVLAAGLFFFTALDLAFKTLDIEADTRGGLHTSATYLGRPAALVFALVLLFMTGAVLTTIDTLYVLAVIPYMAIVALLFNARSNESRNRLDSTLPRYYAVAGLIVSIGLVLI